MIGSGYAIMLYVSERMAEAAPMCRHTHPSSVTSECCHFKYISHLDCSCPMFLLTPGTLRLTSRTAYKPVVTRTLQSHRVQHPTLRLTSTMANMETNNKDLELANLFDVKGKVALVTGGGKQGNH